MIRVRLKISSGVQLKWQPSRRYSKTLCLEISLVLKSLPVIRPNELSCIRPSGASIWARGIRFWTKAMLMKSFCKMLILKGWVMLVPTISGRTSTLALLMNSEHQISRSSPCQICKLKTLPYPRKSKFFKSKCRPSSSNWNPMQSVELKLKTTKDALRRLQIWRKARLFTQAL